MHTRSAVALVLTLAACAGCEKAPDQGTAPAAPPGTEAPATTRPLTLAAEHVQPLRGGASQRYSVALEAGHTLRLEVEQQGVDLMVEFEDPGGHVVLQVDNPNGKEGVEPLAVVAQNAGLHHLMMRAPDGEPRGAYHLRVLKLAPANAADRARAEALAHYLRAEELRRAPATRPQALAAYRQAEDLWRELDDEPLYLARARRRIARTLYEEGQVRQSIAPLQQALPVFRQLTNGWELAPLLNEAGYAFSQLGEPAEALSCFEEALALTEALGYTSGAASALNGMGILHDRLGRLEEALRAYDRAAELLRDLGQGARLATTLHNIGVAYHSVGRLPEAFDHLERALKIRSRLEDPGRQASTLTALGLAHSGRGDEEQALRNYGEALTLYRATRDVLGETTTLEHQGASYHRTHRNEEALASHQAALALLRKNSYPLSEAHTLVQLGRVYLALRDLASARLHAELGLELFQQVHDLQGEATALVMIAQVERRRGRLHAAEELLEDALERLETVRARLQGPAFRRSYLARSYDDFDTYITLLMELDEAEPGQGHAIRAFEAAERVRARGLEEGLAGNRGWRERADPALQGRERELRERIQAREALRWEWTSQIGSSERIAALEEEIRALLVEYEKLDGDLRRSAGPEAIASSTPVDLRTVQSELLDEETTLLAYHLGREESYLWVVDPHRLRVHRLPRRAALQTMTRQVMKDLTRSDGPNGMAQLANSATPLSEHLLFPALPGLSGERLVILADGFLQTLPFAVLPLKPATPQGAYQPLVERFEVVYPPSASVLDLLRKRPKSTPAKTLAVFADPVFEPEDPRWERESEKPAGLSPALARVTRSWGLDKISRLPHTRREAEAILALVNDPRQRFAALNFEATRAAVLNHDLASFRLLHFATHGFLNDRHPSLSGIVLSLLDREGKPLDGFLRVHEIEHLDLAAELVVLSACRTALGEDVRGEGIIGMPQAFFRAGARALLVSHWRVDDEATAVLMERFYTALLGAPGLTPSAALRAAQRSLRAEPRWAAPYFWAAFTLQGDWKQP